MEASEKIHRMALDTDPDEYICLSSDETHEFAKEIALLEDVAKLLIEAKEYIAHDTNARVEITATQSLMLNDAYIMAKAALAKQAET